MAQSPHFLRSHDEAQYLPANFHSRPKTHTRATRHSLPTQSKAKMFPILCNGAAGLVRRCQSIEDVVNGYRRKP